MDLARQRDLHEEAGDRCVEGHLREEGGDGVGIRLPLGRRRGHVQLLLDDGRADRRKTDHKRDELQMSRGAQHADRFASADAVLLARRQQIALDLFAPPDDRHEDCTRRENGRAHKQ